MIVGDLPPVAIAGEVIDDLLIEAEGADIDGPGNFLGQAGPTHLRPKTAGKAAFLPAKGIMSFDKADLDAMQADGTLGDVITHEMGHVLGIGTVWMRKGLLSGEGGANPTFRGPAAMKEYGKLKGGGAGPTPVPVENRGGGGTRDSHWRETVFQKELTTGFVDVKPNPLSRLTVASLQDRATWSTSRRPSGTGCRTCGRLQKPARCRRTWLPSTTGSCCRAFPSC